MQGRRFGSMFTRRKLIVSPFDLNCKIIPKIFYLCLVYHCNKHNKYIHQTILYNLLFFHSFCILLSFSSLYCKRQGFPHLRLHHSLFFLPMYTAYYISILVKFGVTCDSCSERIGIGASVSIFKLTFDIFH